MKKLLIILVALLPLWANAQQLIHFTWDEGGTTPSGYYPGITIHVGESHKLAFSTTPHTDTPFEDLWNWVFYEFFPESNSWTAVDNCSLFTLTPDGTITGITPGIGAIKGTGYIQGAKERFYIEVLPNEEGEPNDTAEDAIELGDIALPFRLSSPTDVDWFKVQASVGDEVVIKVSSTEEITQNYIFHVETFDESMLLLGGHNRTLSPEDSYFEVEVPTITISGWYYVKISFNKPDIFFYDGPLTIQAFINGEPVASEQLIPITENVKSYFNLEGIEVNPEKATNQILIEWDGQTAKKILHR